MSACLIRFNLETRAAFVESCKPPQLVADLHESEDGAISLEVIRCLFRELVEQDAYGLPVCCPPDDVATATNELGDYHWVDISPLGGRRIPISVLPYFGPEWHGRGTVAFMIDAGICTWGCDVWLAYSASSLASGSLLRGCRLPRATGLLRRETDARQIRVSGPPRDMGSSGIFSVQA